jgi:hypothetical protein
MKPPSNAFAPDKPSPEPAGPNPGQSRRLEALRTAARLLDSAVLVPGTSFRIGLDPILGLIPGVGELVSPLFTVSILWHARELGVPRLVLLRMILNVGIDALVGAVPLVGDLFDVAWKANTANLALLERHVSEPRPATSGDRLFVLAVVALLAGVAVAPFVIVAWIVVGVGRILF